MKTTLMMIPMLALGVAGFTNKTYLKSALNSPATTVGKFSHVQSDPLMESLHKMMKQMDEQKMTGNVDLDFATMLRIHHQGAIEMAKAEADGGKDATMKNIAQKILTAQTKEAAELDQLIPNLRGGTKNYDPMQKTSGAGKAMSDGMMRMMKMGNMSMSSMDHEFADMMTKHHKDGIMMSKNILAYCKNAKLRSMAQKGIPEQSKDINEMTSWMKSHQ